MEGLSMKKLLIILSSITMIMPCISMDKNDLQGITEDRALQAALAASLATYRQEKQNWQLDEDEEFAHNLAEIEALEERERVHTYTQEQQDAELAHQLAQEASQPSPAPNARNNNSARKAPVAHRQVRQPRNTPKANRRQNTPASRLRPTQATTPAALQNRNLIYLPSLPQGANQCGHYAAINAKAIQTLVEQEKELTAANIQAEARNYVHLVPAQVTGEVSEILLRYGQSLNLHYLYFIKHDKNTGFVPAGLAPHVDEEIDSFVKSIWVENKVGHFICNTGGHWILLSVIKRPGQEKPRIILLDSANPAQPGHITCRIASTLLDKLGL